MLLKECYIENFGTLSEKNFKFFNGLNIIKEDNGWGKSTLMAFLKAMLYGMDYSRSRTMNDRKKYEPWNGGNYGGNLIFQSGDKTYKVTRFFGKKNTDDTFSLKDMETGMETWDFTENLGKELFGIDLESFERSIYIKLNTGKTPEITDNINAKLNDLIENANDINNFDKANDILNEKILFIKKKKGQTGKIDEVKEKIRKYEENIENCKNIEKRIEAINDKAREYKETREKLKQEKNKCDEAIRRYDTVNKKRQFIALENEKNKTEEEFKIIKNYFIDGIPDNKMIQEVRDKINDMNIIMGNIQGMNFSEEDKEKLEFERTFFSGNLPDRDKLEDIKELEKEYELISAREEMLKPGIDEMNKYNKLDMLFKNENISQELVDEYYKKVGEASKIKEDIEKNKLQLEIMEETFRANKKNDVHGRKLISLSLAFIVVFFGIIYLIISHNLLPAYIIMAVGAIIGIVGFCTGSFRNNRNINIGDERRKIINDLEIKCNEMEGEYLGFIRKYVEYPDVNNIYGHLSEISNMLKEWERLKDCVNEYEVYKSNSNREEKRELLQKFQKQYEDTFPDKKPGYIADKVLLYLKEYEELMEKERRFTSYNYSYNAMKKYADDFFEKYPLVTGNYEEKIQKLTAECLNYSVCKDAYDKALSAYNDFINNYDMNEIRGVEDVSSDVNIQELQDEGNKIQNNMDECTEYIKRAQKEIDDLSVEADNRQQYEVELEKSTEELKELENKYKIYSLTQKLLSNARDNLSVRYLADMRESFKKYVELINMNEAVNINVNLDIHMDKYGKEWSEEYFSSGYNDIMEICVRLALIDAMYKEEQPFIILDDPFVNLDEKKFEVMKEVVEKIAQKRQVIYCICHESRNIGC